MPNLTKAQQKEVAIDFIAKNPNLGVNAILMNSEIRGLPNLVASDILVLIQDVRPRPRR
jgi:hypothetical protein